MARRAGKLREELAALDQEIGTAPPSGRQMHKAIPVAIAFLALFSFGGMTWYAYNQGILEGSEEAAPYLKPSGPLKIAPSSPGGVEVPNRDKFVYNRLENREEDQKVERLLPPPEQPKQPPVTQPEQQPGQATVALPKSVVPRGQTEDTTKAPVAEPKPSQTLDKTKPRTANEALRQAIEFVDKGAPPPLAVPKASQEPKTTKKAVEPAKKAIIPSVAEKEEAPQVTENAPPPKAPIRLTPRSRDAEDKKLPPVKAKAPLKAPPPPRKPTKLAPKPSAAPISKSARAKGYFIQLGALSSRGAAERAWRDARAKNPKLLGNRRLTVEQANVPKKGIYFRVQSGPLADANAAKQLCDALNRRKQVCFVVRRR
jgi:hypothetical protein